MSVRVKIPKELVEKKLNDILDAETRLECSNTFAKMMDPYVPFLEGPLSQTVEVTPEYVRYYQPYAHYQYEGLEFNHTLDYHPLASARWDQAMMRDKGEEFFRKVEKIIRRRASKVK